MRGLDFPRWGYVDGLKFHGVAVTGDAETPFHDMGSPGFHLNKLGPLNHIDTLHFWPASLTAHSFPKVLHSNSTTVCAPMELVTWIWPLHRHRFVATYQQA